MKNLEKQALTEGEQKVSKSVFNNNKLKYVFVVLIVIAIICVIVFGVLSSKDNNAEEIKITTVKQTNNITAEDGESYTYVGEDGNTYMAASDGSYLISDDGTYKISDYKNISLFRTYSYNYANGTNVEFELKNDGTYVMTSIFPSGMKSIASGEYTADNGFEAATDGIIGGDIEDITEGFGIKKETANPNNLYHIVLYWGDVVDYDSNGNQITYETPSKTDDGSNREEFALGDNIADEYILYLDTDSTLKTDADGKKYNDISVIAYSSKSDLLFSPWSTNGSMSVSGVYYEEERGN